MKYGKKAYRRGKRKAKKSWKRKWKKNSRANKTISRMWAPDRYFTKLKYSLNQNIQDASGGSGYNTGLTIVGNNLYDPELNLGGTQPLGFDQLEAMYKNYRVYASKVSVKVHALSGGGLTGVQPYYCSIYPYVGTLPNDPNAYARATQFPYNKTLTRNAYDSSPIIKQVMSTNKIYGVAKSAVKSENDFQAQVSTGPINEWYWRVCFGQLDLSATSNARYIIQVKITYYCEFFNRRIPVVSN